MVVEAGHMNPAKEAALAGGCTAAGAFVGASAVAATGMTAAGMVGGGAGVGCAAGPVGALVGGLVGLATYGVARIFIWPPD